MLKRGEKVGVSFSGRFFLYFFLQFAPETNKSTSLLVLKEPLSETKKRKGNQIALILITNPKTKRSDDAK